MVELPKFWSTGGLFQPEWSPWKYGQCPPEQHFDDKDVSVGGGGVERRLALPRGRARQVRPAPLEKVPRQAGVALPAHCMYKYYIHIFGATSLATSSFAGNPPLSYTLLDESGTVAMGRYQNSGTL